MMRCDRIRFARRPLGMLVIATMLAGCAPGYLPDQSQFEPLDQAKANPDSVVRVCGEYSYFVPGLLLHSWVLAKPADASEFDRWELVGLAWGPNGHVFANRYSPLFAGNGGEVGVLAETTGDTAETVIAFLNANATDYPARDVFELFAGPNCHTFTQWVIDRSGWGVDLPDAAFARNTPVE